MLGLTILKKNQLQNMLQQVESQKLQIQNLNVDIGTLRIELDNVLDQELKYGWNRFPDQKSWIKYIHEICAGAQNWGLSVLSTIYQRAGFVAGSIEVNLNNPEKEKEKHFAEEFFKFNNLTEAGLIDLLANIEKEAKVLLILSNVKHPWTWTDKKKVKHQESEMIAVQYLSYVQAEYEIIPDENNKETAKQFYYYENGQKRGPINQEMFVYSRYRGTPGKINTCMSLFQVCMEHIISLEKCYSDQRGNNHLVAGPKPIIKCKTHQDANETNKLLNKDPGGLNLKRRTALVIVGDFEYAVPDHSPSIENEIKEHIEAISRITGIPAQHLGRADSVRNKNVTENMMEGLGAAIYLDRMHATKWLQELIVKAINMSNGKLTTMDATAVEIQIGQITAADWERLINFYLPSRDSNHISLETFLEKIPGLGVGLELERLKKEKKEKDKEAELNRDKFFDSVVDGERAESIERSKNNEDEAEQTGRFRPGANRN